MAYDEGLAQRVRSLLGDGVTERKMFGGLCFLVNGNMACGIIGDELMVRVGRDGHEAALSLPHTRVMDFTGRPSRGMVYVDPDGIAEDEDLATWVDRGANFARGLPPK